MQPIDGKKIAKGILHDIKLQSTEMDRPPRLAIVTCAPNFETKKYLSLKKRKAAACGITAVVVELPENAVTDDVVATINSLLPNADGLVVQLPLPTQIDQEQVLGVVPPEKDPDCFAGGSGHILPPVAGAIDVILETHDLSIRDKKVVILGHGRLVGKPVADYAISKGADVTVMDEESGIDRDTLKAADVVISGIGQPNFISADMVKDGVVLLDAGTSEEGGDLVGDIASDAYKKSSFYTPVPGGIGPITIAVLLKNLIELTKS